MLIFGVGPEEVLYSYGPLGVGVVAIAFVAYKLLNIVLSDRDKAIADRDALVQDVFTKVLPAISRNTDVLEARQAIDTELIQVIKESNKALEKNTEAFTEARYAYMHRRPDSQSRGS